MGRKTLEVTIDAEGRDKGKRFFITEMPPRKSQRWGLAVLQAAAKAGVLQGALGRETGDGAVKPEEKDQALLKVATAALDSLAAMDPDAADDLLAQLMACVEYCPDKSNPAVHRALHDDAEDIEEVSTLLRLEAEVFALHTGFSLGGLLSTISTPAAKQVSA